MTHPYSKCKQKLFGFTIEEYNMQIAQQIFFLLEGHDHHLFHPPLSSAFFLCLFWKGWIGDDKNTQYPHTKGEKHHG